MKPPCPICGDPAVPGRKGLCRKAACRRERDRDYHRRLRRPSTFFQVKSRVVLGRRVTLRLSCGCSVNHPVSKATGKEKMRCPVHSTKVERAWERLRGRA